jgi:hypothetical protein
VLMLAEIVLPAGTVRVKVQDIPELIANAIHPEVPGDTPRRVTKIKKLPLTESAKNRWCGIGVQAFPISLTNDDLAELAQGCWKDLPPLSFPIDEPSFQAYLDAFQNQPRSDWKLVTESESPHIHQMVYSLETAKEWQKAIEQAVVNGQLVPRSEDTLLPMPNATGEMLYCFVTVAELTTFAARFEIGVKISRDVPEFTTSARPLHVDPALLALDATARVKCTDNIGGTDGVSLTTAGDYRAEIEARIKRQAEGFFTMDEAAQIVADSRPGISVKDMLAQMTKAGDNGQLAIRNYGSLLPTLDNEKIREWLNLVKAWDIDAWLESCGVAYRFPQIATAESSPPIAASNPQVQSALSGWKAEARRIAVGIRREKPHLNVEKIAKKVYDEMTARKTKGDTSVTGRGGKIPSAASIKRHALTGIRA